MVKSIDVYEKLKKYLVFDNQIINNFVNKRNAYANLFGYRLRNNFKIFEIERNKYTLYDDPFLVSSRIIWPSYISCLSALNFYKMTAQIPQRITVISTKNKKQIKVFNTIIKFIKTKNKNLFGFEKIKYRDFEIFIADREKAILDCLLFKKISISEIKEILSENKNLNINKIIKYLKKIDNSSLTKRIGFLLENLGYKLYNKLKEDIDLTYVLLDYSKLNKGKKDKKWRLILND